MFALRVKSAFNRGNGSNEALGNIIEELYIHVKQNGTILIEFFPTISKVILENFTVEHASFLKERNQIDTLNNIFMIVDAGCVVYVLTSCIEELRLTKDFLR